MSDALRTGLPLREPEIIDILLPDLDDEVLDVNMVQRMTDSGRRVSFTITAVVGNGDGFVGVATTRGKEVGPAIRKCIDNAKLKMIEVQRGCGSWECGCLTPHSLPFVMEGKSGSVEVTLRPAPRGVSLAVGDVVKSILRLAGIQDAWGFAKGHTKTTVNFANAAFQALKEGGEMKTTVTQTDRLKILAGAEDAFVVEEPAVEVEEPEEEAAEAAEGEAPAEGAEAPAEEAPAEAPVEEPAPAEAPAEEAEAPAAEAPAKPPAKKTEAPPADAAEGGEEE